jgi:hypothetical protein
MPNFGCSIQAGLKALSPPNRLTGPEQRYGCSRPYSITLRRIDANDVDRRGGLKKIPAVWQLDKMERRTFGR